MISQEQHKRNTRLAPHMMYICPECGKGFRAQPDWRAHLNVKHDYENKTIKDFDFKEVTDQYHECQVCFKWVANAKHTIALLQYHRFMHLPFSQTYRCLHCRSAFSRRRALNDHLESNHMREIEQYEKRTRLALSSEAYLKNTNQQGDLIKKALMNSNIDLEAENQIERNPKELALDRSLSALEEIVRQDLANEEKSMKTLIKPLAEGEHELDQLCEELFEQDLIEPDVENTDEKPSDKCEEVVSIEIDALREDEMELLKQNSTQGADNSLMSPPRKRKRLNTAPNVDDRDLIKHVTYLCPECGESFTNQNNWKDHIMNAHDFSNLISTKFRIRKDTGSFKCLECNDIQYTTKRSELQRHYFQHLPFRAYLKCKLCGRTKTSTSKILNHIKHNHDDVQLKSNNISEPSLKCKYCEKVFKIPGKYEKHFLCCKRIPSDQRMKKLLGGKITDEDIGYLQLIEHLKEAGKRLHKMLADTKHK